MAHHYHLNRLKRAFLKASIPSDPHVRADAYFNLAMKLTRIIERSLTRDDTINKQRKKAGQGYTIEISPQANNNIIIAHMVEAKEMATQQAATLNPSKYANTNSTLVI